MSKTDLMDYWRCPYAYSLLCRGEIDRADLFSDRQVDLLETGEKLHEDADATLPGGLPATAFERDRLLAAGARVLHPQLCVNPRLKIHGMPDGIDSRGGWCLPIEVKSHKNVRRPQDLLELAFYWLLLETIRTRGQDDPRGILVLWRHGQWEEVEVDIPQARLNDVHRLVAAVRQARRTPVQPRSCACPFCSTRPEVLRIAAGREHVSMINGISRVAERDLAAIEIVSYIDLLTHDADGLARALHQVTGRRRSPSTIQRWRSHARAYIEDSPYLFGEPLALNGSFVAIDLEYLTDPYERMWLAGVAVVTDSGAPRIEQFWADDNDGAERKLLADLGAILDARDQMPIVTFNGHSADMPQARKAAERLGVPDPLAGRENVDLLAWLKRSLRLPIPRHRLDDVAAYLGLGRDSGIEEGWETSHLYRSLPLCDARALERTMTELLSYNRDDLQVTVGIAQSFCQLQRNNPGNQIERLKVPGARVGTAVLDGQPLPILLGRRVRPPRQVPERRTKQSTSQPSRPASDHHFERSRDVPIDGSDSKRWNQ